MRDLSEKRWEIPRYKKGVRRMRTKRLILLAGGLAAVLLLLGVVLFPQNSYTRCLDCWNRLVWTDTCHPSNTCYETNWYWDGVACCGHDGYYDPYSTCSWIVDNGIVYNYLLYGICTDPSYFLCATVTNDCINPLWIATLYGGCTVLEWTEEENILQVYKCS